MALPTVTSPTVAVTLGAPIALDFGLMKVGPEYRVVTVFMERPAGYVGPGNLDLSRELTTDLEAVRDRMVRLMSLHQTALGALNPHVSPDAVCTGATSIDQSSVNSDRRAFQPSYHKNVGSLTASGLTQAQEEFNQLRDSIVFIASRHIRPGTAPPPYPGGYQPAAATSCPMNPVPAATMMFSSTSRPAYQAPPPPVSQPSPPAYQAPPPPVSQPSPRAYQAPLVSQSLLPSPPSVNEVMREKEVSELKKQVAALTAKKDSLEQRNNQLQGELSSLKKDLDDAAKGLVESKQEIESKRAHIDTLNQTIQQKELEIARVKQEAEIDKTACQKLNAQLALNQEEMNKLKDSEKTLTKKVEELTAKIKQQAESKDGLKQDQVALLVQKNKLRKELEATKSKRDLLSTKNIELDKQQRALTDQVQTQQARIDVLEKEKAQDLHDRKALETEFQQTYRLYQSARNDLNKAQDDVKHMKGKLSESERAVTTLRQVRYSLVQKNKKLTREKGILIKQLSTTKRELKKSTKLKNQLKNEIKARKGVIDTLNGTIKSLRENYSELLKRGKEMVEARNQSTTHTHELIQEKSRIENERNTLENNLIKAEDELKKAQKEIECLKSELSRSKKAIEQLMQNRDSLVKKNKELIKKNSELREQTQKTKKTLKKHNRLRQQYEELARENKKLREDNDALNKLVQVAKAGEGGAREKLKVVKNSSDKKTGALDKALTEIEKLNSSLKEKTSRISELELKLSEQNALFVREEAQWKQTQEVCLQLTRRIEELNNEIKSILRSKSSTSNSPSPPSTSLPSTSLPSRRFGDTGPRILGVLRNHTSSKSSVITTGSTSRSLQRENDVNSSLIEIDVVGMKVDRHPLDVDKEAPVSEKELREAREKDIERVKNLIEQYNSTQRNETKTKLLEQLQEERSTFEKALSTSNLDPAHPERKYIMQKLELLREFDTRNP